MFRHGALYVVETPSDKEPINRALKQLDDRLFVERQCTLENEWVWCVVCDVGDRHPPITLLEFRGDDGEPIPYLTERIVQRMAQMPRDGRRLAHEVIEKNRRFQEQKKEESRQQTEDFFRENKGWLSGRKHYVAPRGAYLRSKRDKQRDKGWKV